LDFQREESGLGWVDPDISTAITMEFEREKENVNLIASENYTSVAVLQAQGSVLTNKYAEGYPGARYYSGCAPADEAERLAVARAKELFSCEHANVQPHSGSSANAAVYLAALDPGDKIMAMDLSCGGHLTHGAPSNFSGMLYRAVHYGVDRKTELIDYDAVKRERPRVIVAGASAYPRRLDFAAFREIADSTDAVLVVDMAHFAGLVAGRVHPDPVPYADFVTGTTHKTLRGPRGGFILGRTESCRRIDAMVFPGVQGGPLMHVIAAKAVCFKEAMEPGFPGYQSTIVENSRALAGTLAGAGFRIVSGGTDTHLFIVDLTGTGVVGDRAQEALQSVGLNVNKEQVPYDDEPPAVTSGIRLGTPAVTTRGMKPEHMEALGKIIVEVLEEPDSEDTRASAASRVREMAEAFPVYPEFGYSRLDPRD